MEDEAEPEDHAVTLGNHEARTLITKSGREHRHGVRSKDILQVSQSTLGRSLSGWLERGGESIVSLTGESLPYRLPGVGPDEWAIMGGDMLAAKLVHLPGKTENTGILGKLRSMLTAFDGELSASAAVMSCRPRWLQECLCFSAN